MATPIDNATWLLEAGSAVIDKKTRDGPHSLTPWERLVLPVGCRLQHAQRR